MKKKRGSRSSAIWLALMILSLAASCVSAGMLIRIQYQKWKAKKIFEQLAQNTETESAFAVQSPPEYGKIAEEVIFAPPDGEEETAALGRLEWKKRQYYEQYGIEVPEKTVNFSVLHESVTPDIYGWIYIPDTTVDYPLLRHPTDNAYYLEHNLDGSSGYPGCIYTENYNSMDFTDRHTAIYGHNMRDRTMFSDLHLYENNEEFMRESPYVYIYTEDDVFVYRIFAAYETDNTHPILGYDVSTPEAFLAYLDSVMTKASEVGAVVGIGREFREDDKLLTLSTCGMAIAQPLIRYLVQAIYLDVE